MADTPEKPAGAAPEDVFESQLESINIKLQAFEGPLDLLVHQIKKNQMNIYDIQISVVTRQYLEYLDLLQELNLDVASEFLVMAATLIHIKSKMLLPRPETATGDPEDEEDPRDALVRRLLEHQKFKAAAELLHERAVLRGAQWIRPDASIAEIAGDDYAYEPEIEVDLFSLLAAFRGVLERAKQRPPMVLPPEQQSVESRIEELLNMLSETDACGFEDLFAGASGNTAMSFVLIENLRVESYVSAPVLITSIVRAGANVEITFTGPDTALPGDFKLQSSAAVLGSYTDDNSAIITQLGPGSFKATTALSGPAHFYRIKL